MAYLVVELYTSGGGWNLRLVSPSTATSYWTYDIDNVSLVITPSSDNATLMSERVVTKYGLTGVTSTTRVTGVSLTLDNIIGRIG